MKGPTNCLSATVSYTWFSYIAHFCMQIKIMKPITCLLLVKDFCLFSVTISRKNIKKSETQEQELFNNLICPKNGCLSSTLTFVCYWGGGIKGVHCRLSVASFTEESPVFGFPPTASLGMDNLILLFGPFCSFYLWKLLKRL